MKSVKLDESFKLVVLLEPGWTTRKVLDELKAKDISYTVSWRSPYYRISVVVTAADATQVHKIMSNKVN